MTLLLEDMTHGSAGKWMFCRSRRSAVLEDQYITCGQAGCPSLLHPFKTTTMQF